MIVEVKAQNFLSFKDGMTFSLEGVKAFQEREVNNVIGTYHGRKLLKSAAILGDNGSGKSNVLKAIGHMRRLVIDAFAQPIGDPFASPPDTVRFRLSADALAQPTYLEISFLLQDHLYRLGVEMDGQRVLREWLYQTDVREVALYTRVGDTMVVNKTHFPEGLPLVGKVQPDDLFLTRVAQKGGRIASAIYLWFKQIGYVNAVNEAFYRSYTVDRMQADPDFCAWAAEVVAFLGYTRLSVVTEDQGFDTQRFGRGVSPSYRESFRALFADCEKRRILGWQMQFDTEGLPGGEVAFHFEKEASASARRLLYLLGPIYDSLQNGKLLLIDEFTAQLQPHMLQRLLGLFHVTNQKGAQFVLAGHGEPLLSMGKLRRDQLWFVEKDELGASTLSRLDDADAEEEMMAVSAFDARPEEPKSGAMPQFLGM